MSQTTLFDIAGFDSSVQGSGWVVGVDEVGRGPLIGEVVAAAVILPDSCSLRLNDSKKLSESRREALSEQIKLNAHAYAIASASPAEIDELNILNATMLAMQRAVEAVSRQVEAIERVLVDGNRCPKIPFPCQAIIKGDGLVAEISAASILAKVERDAQMLELDQIHPQYGFAQHKGYPTANHLHAIEKHGLLPGYRRSFKPVKRLLGNR